MATTTMKRAYSEIDSFLDILTDDERNKVPENIRYYFKNNKDISYTRKIDPKLSICEQHLMRETLTLIALLNLEYWCEDEEEKQRLISIYEANDKRHSDDLNNRLNNLNFQNDGTNSSNFNSSIMKASNVVPEKKVIRVVEQRITIVKKETVFMKIIHLITGLFKRRRRKC